MTVENRIKSTARMKKDGVILKSASNSPKMVAMHFPPRKRKKIDHAWPKTGASIRKENR